MHEYKKEKKKRGTTWAAMIALTVVKWITGVQWAYTVFDDGRNDCTSL